MLDYSIKDPIERAKFVNDILENSPPLNEQYKEILADYIIYTSKTPYILTPNRLVTINKRETSYQGLAEKFENGEDRAS